MKILQVIHGYPMRYNAGSEVYTQTLCHGLAKSHEIHVFTREEDCFSPDYRLRAEHDALNPRITIHLVNNPRNRDRYSVAGIDRRFVEILERIQPDVIHVGHLNHLSTSFLHEAARREIPIVYTLHDYWIMCPRGQFIQMFPEDPEDLWATCDGQDDRRCAERCYSRYSAGTPDGAETDVAHWTEWVGRRMRHMREMTELVDMFVAPSRYLSDRYRKAFGLPESKLVLLDYGFNLQRMSRRQRIPGEPFTFGYIGTHIPAKGVHDLIRAFCNLRGEARLRIWGRHSGQDTDALKAIARESSAASGNRIEWLPEYRNEDIVGNVFNHVDAIVVPSVWVENSPLVIHEAQQARVPVITADAGGMAELVRHEVNGLLFEHRSRASLTTQMQRFVEDPVLAERLGKRGYLHDESGDIPGIDEHVAALECVYEQLLQRRESLHISRRNGPWRITFDTNPDSCNMHCIMCEEHSHHSNLQALRTAKARPHRLMPMELMERIVRSATANGLREIIPSTMGEPLLYPEFNRILALCAEHNVKLNLTTNGTFPQLGASAWAERIVPVASDVKISLNGATKTTQESIMVGSNWAQLQANVREFIVVRNAHAARGGSRCRLTFQLTFLEANVAELADIVRLAIALGIDRVKGHHVWVHFHQLKEQSMRRSPEAISRWNDAVAQARLAARERKLGTGRCIELDGFDQLAAGAESDLAPDSPCPFLGQEAWVSAAGRFDPCCAPDAQRRLLGDFGSLLQLGLRDIWNGEAYRELLATYRTRTLCLGCNMRRSKRVVQ